MKRFLTLLLVVSLLFSLTACGGMDTDVAKEKIALFLDTLESDQPEEAAALMHPDYREENLQEFLDLLCEQYGIKFSDGIRDRKQTGFHLSFYNSKVDGSLYEATYKASVSGKDVFLTITVVENDNGFGVAGLNVKA